MFEVLPLLTPHSQLDVQSSMFEVLLHRYCLFPTELGVEVHDHDVEQTRKPTNSFMILSKNDFVEFSSSQPSEILKNDIE